MITYILLIFMGLYGLSLLIEFLITHAAKRFLCETAFLLGFIIVLRVTTNFPSPSGEQAFGGVSSVTSVGIMFVCTLLGIAARYYHELGEKEKLSWRRFLKPLLISPIVLLPLMGSMQGTSDLEPIQLISFGILAFQNGFFWRVVFERARKSL